MVKYRANVIPACSRPLDGTILYWVSPRYHWRRLELPLNRSLLEFQLVQSFDRGMISGLEESADFIVGTTMPWASTTDSSRLGLFREYPRRRLLQLRSGWRRLGRLVLKSDECGALRRNANQSEPIRISEQVVIACKLYMWVKLLEFLWLSKRVVDGSSKWSNGGWKLVGRERERKKNNKK